MDYLFMYVREVEILTTRDADKSVFILSIYLWFRATTLRAKRVQFPVPSSLFHGGVLNKSLKQWKSCWEVDCFVKLLEIQNRDNYKPVLNQLFPYRHQARQTEYQPHTYKTWYPFWSILWSYYGMWSKSVAAQPEVRAQHGICCQNKFRCDDDTCDHALPTPWRTKQKTDVLQRYYPCLSFWYITFWVLDGCYVA